MSVSDQGRVRPAILATLCVLIIPSCDGGGVPTLPLTEDFDAGTASGWEIVSDESDDPANWAAEAGTFAQTANLGRDRRNMTGAYHLGTYSYLRSSRRLSDYRFSVAAIAGDDDGEDIGVMFRYVDPENYYRFSMNSQRGFARLEKREEGRFSTLAANRRGYPLQQWQDITVEVTGSLIKVYLNQDPLFSTFDTSHATGGIALYARGPAVFDDLLITENSSDPAIVISSPVAHTVLPGGTQDLTVTAVASNTPTENSSVEVRLDSRLCDPAIEVATGVYSAQCRGVTPGDHAIEVSLQISGISVARDSNASIAIGSAATGSHSYDAIGNSITEGVGDNYSTDNLNLVDQRTRSFRGWPALLGDLLSGRTENNHPSLVTNEGISGDDIVGASEKISAIIERNPHNDRAIVMLGTNDANPSRGLPSGAGCSGADCEGTFKGYLLEIISQLKAAGREVIYLPTLPPVFGDATASTPYPDPLAQSATRNWNIRSYNAVIVEELSALPEVELGPDFFSCFLTPAGDRYSLFSDNLHPNGLGYRFMAELWADWLGNPGDRANSCRPPLYTLENISPLGYQQNVLEPGDTYYVDEEFTLSNIPEELAEGIWIMPRNDDRAQSSESFVSFDVGEESVTVYIAYDPAEQPPEIPSGQTLTPYEPSSDLEGTDPSTPMFALARASGVRGNVIIGGTLSTGAGSRTAVLVIVVK